LITKNIDEIKPILYAKILECCNEAVVIEFTGEIIKQLDLDSAVKEILKERIK
jgi:hypothetical protein